MQKSVSPFGWSNKKGCKLPSLLCRLRVTQLIARSIVRYGRIMKD